MYKGLFARIIQYIKFALPRNYARFKGAKIGQDTIIPWKLARKANCNLIVGNDCIIETSDLDLRDRIEIKDHVIINKEVKIIRLSHKIDGDTYFTTRKYSTLMIESYVWLATGCKIMPNVSCIDSGSVIGAYAVLFNNTGPMSVIGVNGKLLRYHDSKFEDLAVVSLKGGDLRYWLRALKYI